MDKCLEFVEKEKEILDFWQKNKVFEKSIKQRSEDKSYVFYDGPPFATGLPHYGHILASLIKDAVPRYWAMRGFRIERVWGWDCHGLPVENLIEQELNLKNKKDIEEIGVDKFNQACKESVLRYVDEWKKVIPRIGRWVDMEHSYKTMDFKYMESIWWVFKQLWDKGLIYEGYKSMHICPRCGTTLSNFEVSLGYKETKDISITLKFKLKDQENTFILAWTTTPWTLPGNVALAVGKDIDYVKIQVGNEYYILAEKRLEVVKDEYRVIEKIKGKDLIGLEYEPLFDYFSKQDALENKQNGWKIYSGEFVSIEEGTGVVHIAPAFGEDDLALGRKEKLPFIQHVGGDGCFIKEVREWAEEEVKPKEDILKTDKKIIQWLKNQGKLFNQEEVVHKYPFCWRCDSPLLNYATSSWFVKVTAIKDKIIKNNQKINWVPDHIKDGRFGKLLEEAPDWSISRSRYWGTPIPIWRCQNDKGQNCDNIKVIGSVKELEELSGKKIEDLHRPYIDEVTFKCEKCGGTMKRIPEVLDCWFESGSMPYAQAHYPFENKENFEKNFPAQFVAEGIDQTRGWFYTLMVLSTALFDQPAFLNNIVNGIILTEDGQKMSKRLKNYPEPMKIIDKYGADAMRLYLLNSPAIKADDLCFSEKGVDQMLKKNLIILWNVFGFYKLYALKTKESFQKNQYQSLHVLDKWILSKMNALNKAITEAMEKYDLSQAVKPIEQFIDDLSIWYLRRSRQRFKDTENSQKASPVLKHVLFTLSKLISPFVPFISEQLYQSLKNEDDLISVHLCDYPKFDEELIDKKIEKEMEIVREIISLALAERAQEGLKVRQPLGELRIKNDELKDKEELLQLIKDEVNVKKVVFDDKLKKEMEIDKNITPELKEEGMMREGLRQIQVIRKKANLLPTDEIIVSFQGDDSILQLFKKNENQIKKELKIKEISWNKVNNFEFKSDIFLDSNNITIFLKKVN
ncbi:MAG: isoleucine--tRNA ligase [Candidatus Pacebacteria bacterium]|jgi:isoleucyl-tRNA synthetase|nr:isoleucine--tRNA ligase [Candidatus Paceibacterota bacterium]MDD4994396.1 isoleucine--tRNA ligase [Candidatus Paceibacterota bacterium]MDD5535101.1 isoleucine--tRNA ligase [Candidatus Paceibacterota bacterium]